MNYLKLLSYSFSLVFLIMLSSFQRLHAQSCPTILSAGGVVEVCKGGNVDLFAELNTAPTGITFTWTGSVSGLLKMATGPAGTFMSYTPTVTEVVTVTAAKSGCTTLVDKVKVIVHDGATFTKCRIIDNFDEPDGTTQQTVMVKSPILGGPNFQTKTFTGLNAGGLIGNKRTMNIWYVVGDLTSRADVLKESDITSPYFNEWFYSSSNDEGNESNTELVYGGTGADQLNWDGICDCLDPNGVPDASAGFRLYNYFADQSGVTMTVTITDGTGKIGTIVRNMPGSGFGDYDEEFALVDFTVANGFNWCDIDKISLFMNTNFISVDFKFDQFDFCCLVKAELGDNSIKKCLGSCIKLDTLFNCPIPSGLIGSHNVNWKDPNGNSVAYNAVICPSTAGMFNYTVNIKDSLGCESNFTQTFKICDTPSISLTNVAICRGQSVVLSPTITGGNPPLSYLWSPATGLSCTTCANPTANPTTTTTYTLIVSTTENGDNGINACSGSKKVTVTVNDLPDGSITGATGLCNGATTTQICAKQAPAVNITYSWSTLETTRCINVGAGTYTLTVTNTTTGCTATSQVTISPVPSPSVTVSSDKNNVCEGTKVILTAVGSGGTTPYTFTWSTGQSGNPIQVTPSAPSSTYIVTITDINGCTGTNTITINATPNDIQVNVTTKPDICSKKIGEATANPTGGAPPYSYAWSNGGNTQTITGLSPGSYTVTVTDISGCSRSATGTVGTVAGPSVNITGASPICAGGSVTLTANATGGTAPITYSWSPGGMTTSAVTVSPGSTTTYTVVVTDGNGCTASNSVEVLVNPKPQVTITPLNPVICQGAKVNLTAITSGGTPSYSYLWSPSTGLSCTTCQNPDASPTADQIYQVIVTDSKGCKDTAQVLVKVNNNPTPSLVEKTNEQCGKKNGTITVTATGGVSPYSYLWNTSPQQTGNTATGLAAGTYTVTVTDNNGCTGTFSTSIINEGGPTVDITGASPICAGGSVTLTANASGWTAPITYSWSPGGMTTSSVTVSPGSTTTYTVVVTDGNGCSASKSVEVLVNPKPQVTITPLNPVICQGFSVSLTAITSGGTPTFSYLWSPSTGLSCTTCQNPVASPTADQNYQVIVTDSKGCKDTAQVLVKVNNNPTPSLVGKTNEQCNKKNGSITVTATGGESPYSYLWNTSPQQTGTTATGLAGGTYTVTVTDKNGCTGTLAASIINEGGPTVNITGTNPNCIGDNVTLTANPSPKLPNEYTYQWSAGLGTNQTATINNVLITNDYFVTVTDKQTGCTATATYTVQVIGCAVVTHFKEFVSVTQTGLNTYDVAFKITVDNIGTGIGKYNLKDSLAFDKDVVVNAIKYSTNAVGNPGNPGTIVPPSDGNNRYDLAVNQNITDVEVHVYNLTVSVTLNLAGTPPPGGDGSYKPCAEVTPGDYIPENGLYNLSILDTPNDFNDERDEACGELPIINHVKSGPVVVKQGPNTYDVTYTITVTNSGFATGKYTLNDIPGLENDFEVLSAQYTSTAPGNPANPGPIGLTLSGPWNLANDQNIIKQTTHTYQVKLQVKIDLVATASVGDEIYTPCGANNPNVPQSGEGLFNRTTLDVNDDGIPDQRDTVCADIKIIDLALRKVILNPAGSYKYGDNITFRITVFNQGNTAVEDVKVADYLPAGLKYEGGDPNWTIVSANELEGTLPGVLNPGASKTIDLTLRIVASSGGSFDWINFAEIKKAFIGTDEVSDEDIDSDPYSNSIKENAVKPGSPDDNVITEDGKNNPEEDEDDHDPAGIEVFDLALKKTTTANGPYQYGSVVPFVITVYNQGSIQARDVVVVDYIPSGFAFGPGNVIWTNGIGMATTTIPSINPGSSVNVTINLVVQPGSNPVDRAWYNEAEIKTAKDDKNITQTEDIDSRFNMNPDDDNDVVIDGADDNEINEDGKNDPQQDEDDNDPAAIKIWDLALKKVFVSGSINYNNPLTFRIWVYNQGNETAKDIKIVDYIPIGYSFSSGLNPGWVGAYPNVNYTIAGPIVPGDSAFVDIILTLENTSGGFRKWINYSEIVSSKDLNNANRSNDDIDSQVGSDGPLERAVLPGRINDNNISSTNKGAEEDDHDPAGTGIEFGDLFDLALRKTVITAGPYSYGQDVDFNIRIFNQGNLTAQNINVVDYVPAGFQFIAGGVNAAWSYSAGLSQASRIVSGPLKPGDSLDITIRLRTISNPGSSTAYINFSEIKSAQDSLGTTSVDIDSNPDDNPNNDIGGEPGGPTDNLIDDDGTIDEDDHDPAMINVYDLALIKVTATAGPYSVGQVVDFKITVINQGTLPVKNVVVNDYIPIGYTYNAGDNAGIWSGSHPLVTHTHAPQLNPGDNFEVILKLRLAGTSGGYTNWINYSEIKSMQSVNGTDVSSQDVDSDPNGNTPGERAVTPGSTNDDNITDITKAGDQDDHDPAGVNIFDLALRKSVVTGGPYAYGQDVDFKISIFNQGNITAKNIAVVDYIPDGFQFIAGGVNAAWTYSAGNKQATRTVAGPLGPGQSTDVTIRLRLFPNGSAFDAYTNYSEIKSAQDSLGVSGNDFDSDPDDDPTNDDGGEPGGPTDDEVTKAPPVDEDDHDPAIINIFDLALRKKLVTPATGPYTYGQTHTFEITVFNQGNVTAKDIQVKDYIPEGYSFSPNNGWTGAFPTVSKTITDTIQPGGSRTITLNLTFNMVAVPSLKSWANYAEIAGANDLNGVPGDDVDSDPGSNTTNEQNVIPGKPGDDDIASNSDTGFGSQDDHDPAGPWIFDLATKIENSSNEINFYGELINFPIEVHNQGNIPTNGYTVSVNIPSGFAFNPAFNPSWVFDNGIGLFTYVSTNVLNPGETDQFNIVLTAQPSNGPNAWTVEIEISKDHPIADEVGIKDIDSKPDNNFSNDAGGSPLPDSEDGNYPGSDDILNGAGNGVIGGTSAAGDEDDNDPEFVQVFDLALRKTLISPAAGPYTYGQNHTFKVTIFNQGNISAKNVLISDFIPDGYSFTNNNGWTGGPNTITNLITSVIKPGDSVVLTLVLKFQMASLLTTNKTWINYSEITSAQDTLNVTRTDVDSEAGSNGPNENNVLPGKLGDDDISSNSDNGVGSQDDHDPAGPWIFDLATVIENSVDRISSYGELITFPIKVKNQGNIASAGYTLSVLVPDGFAFTQGPNTNWVYNNVTRIASYTVPVTDTIKPGEMDMYNIILTSQPASGKHAWTVEIEISSDNPVADEAGINDIDSNPDAVFNNDPGGAPIPDSEGGNFPGSDDILNGAGNGSIGDTNAAGDEDDNDPEYVKIYDLALKKLLDTPPPYAYDQNLTYRVRIFNQGNEPVRNVRIQDYIPIGFSLVGAMSPLWVANANGAEFLYTGTLNPTDSIDFVITLKLVNTKGGYRDWINYAEITNMQDTLGNNVNSFDVDSRPASNGPGELAVSPGDAADNNITSIAKGGEEDDHDPAGIQVFDVALRKNYIGTLPIKYNQVVPFEVTVFNQGNRSAQNFVIADYLAPGYEFDVPSNANWTYNNVTRIAKTTISAKVLPGDSAKVTLYLTVKPTLYNKAAWKNFAEIVTVTDTTNTPGDDIDSDPDDNPNNDGPPKDGEVDEKPPVDEDDQDPAEPPVVDFALRKWIPGKKPYYIPGDTVDFVISIHNQGNVVSSSVGVNDYIPQGFQFLPAINAGWAFNGPRLEYTYGTRLYPEDSVQLHLKLKVIVAANPSIPDWENYAEIRSVRDTFNVNRDNDDADSKPNTDNAWERAVHDEDPWDDVIDGNNQIENEDSDDHDPEKVVVTAWIGDYVWKDLDGDGVQDNNEPGVPGVHVYLYKCSNGSLVKKDTTDANGKYEFDFLLSDDYFLRFDALPINMPNCAFTFKDKGGNDAKDSDVDAAGITSCTFLQWGERDSTWDAGLVELASYGDYVWHDRNANGIQEVGEEGVGGVLVTLYDAVTNLPVKTTTTDNNGLYLFEKLMPMQYYAKYDPPAGWNITTANVGNDTKDSDVDNSNGPRTNATTYLSPGENDRTWDLGIWRCVMIGGRVFFDVDKDGIFDPSENGLNGLKINLIDYNSGSVVATLLTAVNPATPSDDGYYKFACVKPGTYYVQFERPGHLAASEPLRGGNADKDSDIGHENGVNSTRKIVVLSGDMVLNIGAGFQNKATVGDYVWLDRNLNGLQDSGEQPIPGVKVNAYNNTTGVMVSEATTGSDGHYMLDGIAQGDYYVKFIPPVNYGFTAAHSGTDPVDNDVDGTNGYGTTRVYRIQTGDALPTIDAGLVGAVLAIEWLNFTGHHNGSFTELNWQTGVELNNDHFEIERRHESETGFTVIGQELASEDGLAAKHNYGYDDFDASKSGIYYYRLKQVDKDGHFTYSKIISIQIKRGSEFKVSIYPNPVDNLLKVDITLGDESELEVRVFDKSGKNVLTNPFGGFRKAGKFNEILDTSILPAGQYNLQILTSHGIVNKQFTVLR